MNISYSQVTLFRQCQQAYTYKYINDLERRTASPAPTLGRVLHSYLEWFHRAQTRLEGKPKKAHAYALRKMTARWGPELKGLAFAAQAAGSEELGIALSEMLDKARRIATHYFETRGRRDFETERVLLVEEEIEYPLARGIKTPLVIDLVTENEDGSIRLWEHKTGANIPPAQRRLKDLQTVLYAAVFEETYDLKVTEIVWNYLRTREPEIPQVLKNKKVPELSRKQDLSTSTVWSVYLKAIEDAKLDPEDYRDMEARLVGSDLDNFFPRMVLPVMQSEQVLLRDFITTAQTIRTIREGGASFVPVRSVAFHCDFCEFAKLCEAAILGFGDEDIVHRLFKKREPKPDREEVKV